MDYGPTIRTRIKFPPVGRCIYCGTASVPLSMEHIIPESLCGTLELYEASCNDCASIIKRYEQTVARTLFGDFRIRHNMKSKRPKNKRPKTKGINVILHNGDVIFKHIDRSEYPAPLIMYKFGTACVLRGLCPGTGIFEWIPYVIQNDQEMRTFHQTHGNILYAVKMVPRELARAIAKIGYSGAIAEFGYGSFDPLPHILDTILCRTDDVSYAVGGDLELSPPIPDAGHLRMFRLLIQPPNPPLIIADIRLFASMSSPNFHAVVGTFNLQNPQQLRAFREKVQHT